MEVLWHVAPAAHQSLAMVVAVVVSPLDQEENV